jgi:hypothetical protein
MTIVDKIKSQNSLTREQKQAVGVLSIGTFLEYSSMIFNLTIIKLGDLNPVMLKL